MWDTNAMVMAKIVISTIITNSRTTNGFSLTSFRQRLAVFSGSGVRLLIHFCARAIFSSPSKEQALPKPAF